MAKEKGLKAKKKSWYQLVAPKLFAEQVIGEALAADPETIVGKTVKVNAMNVTQDPKKSNLNVTFKAEKVESTKVRCAAIGFEIVKATVRRLVKRNKDKIDLSFKCKTLDNVEVQIKPLLVTRSATTGKTLAGLNHAAVEAVKNAVAKQDYYELLYNVIAHKFQNMLKAQMKKVYPLKSFEIRMLHVVKGELKEKPPKKKEPRPVKEAVKPKETKAPAKAEASAKK